MDVLFTIYDRHLGLYRIPVSMQLCIGHIGAAELLPRSQPDPSSHACMHSIRKFAAKNVEVVVLLATAYAWLTAMMVIALVPIDVWAAYIMSSATEPIFIMWNIAYWCGDYVCCRAVATVLDGRSCCGASYARSPGSLGG